MKSKKKSLSSKSFNTLFNFHRTEQTKKVNDRLDRYNKQKHGAKRKNCKKVLILTKKVLVLVERIGKKSAPGKFYKQSVRNNIF